MGMGILVEVQYRMEYSMHGSEVRVWKRTSQAGYDGQTGLDLFLPMWDGGSTRYEVKGMGRWFEAALFPVRSPPGRIEKLARRQGGRRHETSE